MTRYRVLAPHLHDGVPLTSLSAVSGVAYRTLQRWLASYRTRGLDRLTRPGRSDKGRRKIPAELVAFIEGLALTPPRPRTATIHRQAESVAAQRGWPAPGYWTVHDIVTRLNPALMTMAHQGAKKYRETYDLVYRREAARPNQIWQADHECREALRNRVGVRDRHRCAVAAVR